MNNDEKIKNLLKRGVEEVFPSVDFVAERLKSGKKITIFLGIDPTGPSLHLGHAIALKKLKEFQELGHKVILLIGDFTAMIGDPTDKSATRNQLTHKKVLRNAKLYKTQASKFLRFRGLNKAEIKYNSKWLSKMRFEEVLKLASNMTVEQMSKRDMFAKRAESNKPVYIHEFLYPLMQGYDSVFMNVDGEIGGNDQMFNMLAGRTLMKQILDKDKFVITMKLLVDSTGKKMGKTEGNMLTLIDTPQDMFGKIMSWTDKMIIPGFELCTDINLDDIKKELNSGGNPKEIKIKLAKEIIKFYYNESNADVAEKEFTNTFSGGGLPEEVLVVKTDKNTELINIDFPKEIFKSKNEIRRLVNENAITNTDTGKKINDVNIKFEKTTTLKIGKRRFVKLTIK